MTRAPGRTTNAACVAFVALAISAGLVACGTDPEDRAAVAAAKCASPVAAEAGFPEGSPPRYEATWVEHLGGGRYRVTGTSAIIGEVTKEVTFVCEVEPDSSDELRGFAVTELEVTTIT